MSVTEERLTMEQLDCVRAQIADQFPDDDPNDLIDPEFGNRGDAIGLGLDPDACSERPDGPLMAALEYASLGLHVVPIRPHSKVPSWRDWVQRATIDPDAINAWWAANPNDGVGIATGEQSDVFVLDVDTAPGKDGEETLADLQEEHGQLPDTLESLTGSGGRHIFFRWPQGHEIRNSASTVLGIGLDIRGNGGQVVAAPTVHPNGKMYEWEGGVDPRDTPIADAPNWLLDLLAKPAERAEARRERSSNAGNRPGDLWEADHTWAELLEADGAKLVRAHEDSRGYYELWSRPPMRDEPDFEAHVSASLYYKGSDVLKVFTTNWQVLNPDTGELVTLEPEATYSKFAYWTATRHGGDFTASAGAAVAAGYQPVEPPNGDMTVTSTELVTVPKDPVTGEPLAEGDRLYRPAPDELLGDSAPEEFCKLDYLSRAFWLSRPDLQSTWRTAMIRRVSPDALLAVENARIMATVSRHIAAPPTVGAVAPLNYFAMTMGQPSKGKSATMAAAKERVPFEPFTETSESLRQPRDVKAIGRANGEGFIEAFNKIVEIPSTEDGNKRVKTETRKEFGGWSVFAEIDEGKGLLSNSSKQGSTTIETLTTLKTGGDPGSTGAVASTTRSLPVNCYRACAVVATQPAVLAAMLDYADVGLPQRFLVSNASRSRWVLDARIIAEETEYSDQIEPLEFVPPSPKAHSTSHDFVTYDTEVRRQIVMLYELGDIDPEDMTDEQRELTKAGSAHTGHNLLNRIVESVALAVRRNTTPTKGVTVSLEDWDLAGQVVDVSNRHWRRARQRARQEGTGAGAAVVKDKAVRDARSKDAESYWGQLFGQVHRKLERDPESTWAQLRSAMKGDVRGQLAAALGSDEAGPAFVLKEMMDRGLLDNTGTDAEPVWVSCFES